MTRFIVARSLAMLCVSVLASCSSAQREASKVAGDAQKSVSPIVGAWAINGDTPPPQANLPQFVRLAFKGDGTLDASYVAAGGALAKVIDTTAKLKREHDSYTLDGDKHLSIVEGSRSLDFTYEVRDGKLFLTPKGATSAIVYAKAEA